MIRNPNSSSSRLGGLSLPPMNKAHKKMAAKGPSMAPMLAADALKAYLKKDYASSIVLWNASNKLSPHPIYLYNIGRSYQRIGTLAAEKGPANIAKEAINNSVAMYKLAIETAKKVGNKDAESKSAPKLIEVIELQKKLSPKGAEKEDKPKGDEPNIQGAFPIGLAVGAGLVATIMWLRSRK
jgi:hypothetical protein